jgi:hypothetical protein
VVAFKVEFGHCNVPQTRSRNNKHASLGRRYSDIRGSYKVITKGGMPRCKLSKADIQRLEVEQMKIILDIGSPRIQYKFPIVYSILKRDFEDTDVPHCWA